MLKNYKDKIKIAASGLVLKAKLAVLKITRSKAKIVASGHVQKNKLTMLTVTWSAKITI